MFGKALELRQALGLLDTPCERRPSPTRYRFQPWSQESYCKRLFTYEPDRWNSRLMECECTEAALNGWICVGQDRLMCEECSSKIYQPWLPDIEENLGIFIDAILPLTRYSQGTCCKV
jgi:hypothetical protein